MHRARLTWLSAEIRLLAARTADNTQISEAIRVQLLRLLWPGAHDAHVGVPVHLQMVLWLLPVGVTQFVRVVLRGLRAVVRELSLHLRGLLHGLDRGGEVNFGLEKLLSVDLLMGLLEFF